MISISRINNPVNVPWEVVEWHSGGVICPSPCLYGAGWLMARVGGRGTTATAG